MRYKFTEAVRIVTETETDIKGSTDLSWENRREIYGKLKKRGYIFKCWKSQKYWSTVPF